jgi:hypothetical protein
MRWMAFEAFSFRRLWHFSLSGLQDDDHPLFFLHHRREDDQWDSSQYHEHVAAYPTNDFSRPYRAAPSCALNFQLLQQLHDMQQEHDVSRQTATRSVPNQPRVPLMWLMCLPICRDTHLCLVEVQCYEWQYSKESQREVTCCQLLDWLPHRS